MQKPQKRFGQRKAKVIQKSRKDLRKEKRQQKKVNRFNYHNTKKLTGKNKDGKPTKIEKKESQTGDEEFSDDEEILSDFSDGETPKLASKAEEKKETLPVDKFKQHMEREKKEADEYYDGIKKNRVEQLQQQNEEEEKVISKYEKLLKLNKRKRKNGTTSTAKFTDGLDYLLELCTDESIQKMYTAAKEAHEQEGSDDDEANDFNMAIGSSKKKKISKKVDKDQKSDQAAENFSDAKSKKRAEKLKEIEKKYFGDDEDFFKNFDADSCDGSDSELDSEEDGTEQDSEYFSEDECSEEEVAENEETGSEAIEDEDNFDVSEEENDPTSEDENDNEDDIDSNDDSSRNLKKPIEKERPDEWEDIYGKKRDKDGNVIKETIKYVPPHLRKAAESSSAVEDPKRAEKLKSLTRQIKGYINKIAESNLHRISIDIENLYSSNARYDINSTLTNVILESLISNTLAVERLVLEQMLLIATLHANIGSEIGAFFLQIVVERFDSLMTNVDSQHIGNKELDNVIFIICHLYTYRLFKHSLIYELLNRLCEKMNEKRVECTLLILRSVGFILRKDDPLMLKEFIVKIQKLANDAGSENIKNTRITFMLDILIAIKNNNVSKIPQFDPSLVEHFRKLLKQFVRAGKYVTTLAITMEDLLKANECGKWWLVGSAWSGAKKNAEVDESSNQGQNSVQDKKREKIFELAKKQRMNTDDKRNVFYILMTADDYLDAFEKIVSAVKDVRTIIAVIIHCCLSEKEYNPYYSVIAQKFCDLNRKYLLAIQFALWDKIKDVDSLSIKQVSNLAKFLISLIENGNLPMSVLKVIEFNQIEKTTLRFLRQVMLGLLLIEEEKFHTIFERISPSVKLNPFKDQLRLFMKVFLMKDESKVNISENQLAKLKERMQLADKFLHVKHF